jgi:WD40 repeat protein
MRVRTSHWLVAWGIILATAALRAEPVTTTPLQLYGLGSLDCAAYSPDGKYILTGGSSAGAFLCDAATGKVVRMFLGHQRFVTSVAFSPDGTKVLTGSDDWTARLWNVSDGAVLRTFWHTAWVTSVAFSPDGTKVLTGSHDGTARLWQAVVPTSVRLP